MHIACCLLVRTTSKIYAIRRNTFRRKFIQSRICLRRLILNVAFSSVPRFRDVLCDVACELVVHAWGDAPHRAFAFLRREPLQLAEDFVEREVVADLFEWCAQWLEIKIRKAHSQTDTRDSKGNRRQKNMLTRLLSNFVRHVPNFSSRTWLCGSMGSSL